MERSKRSEKEKSSSRSRRERDRSRDGDAADHREESGRREKKERDHDRNKENSKDKEKERDRERDRDDRRRDRDAAEAGEHKSRRDKEKEREKGEDFDGDEQEKEVAATKEIEEWVRKSRKIEKIEKVRAKKAVPAIRSIAQQDEEVVDEEDDEESAYKSKDLAGMKIRHGLEKIIEGGEVVLTLKDSNILAEGDINEDADELENVNLTEQTVRSNAYRDAKKKKGTYEDKFQNDINTVKSLLPQYDDAPKDEGIQLDDLGGVNEESQKRLEEVRLKLQGAALKMQSLLGPENQASDFYTKEEMMKFKKPRKQKKLRKKDMLDVDALEAEAKAAGLGADDLGSRANNSKPKQEAEAEEEDELYSRLQKSRELAIRQRIQSTLGPQGIAARLKLEAADEEQSMDVDSKTSVAEKTVVITETEEFCLSLQPDEVISRRAATNDAFGDDEVDGQSAMEIHQEDGRTDTKVNDVVENEDDDVFDELPIKEVSVGKGLAGALSLLKERGSLKESVEWGGRNMDKKASKLVGVLDDDKTYERDIQLDRRDEYGRTLTPKEAFRLVSHKFHGKNPGKRKQEKKMKQHEEELKQKQMAAGDTPLRSMEKMREVQMKTSTPYIVMSGHIKPGQTSDPRSGFATVEKEPIGSLTPMLGDKKVEHFLGIKRPAGDMGPPLSKKKART
ncbi:hypothetical protein SELMODRAFT_404232 [Selaginella moellendorffii]|uniref:SART-1 family protein n=1 Tax=Selaginella moellendorffii TaxID=88036 RepID=D8QUP5_SELML|nr:SART-1 family protein DOT2 [Selaginella moellendorffii]EFJ36327.1 hypothetical protein SELMODRAFT_404232 [Selaginella moellendorffii]|eukprot:XP_002962864.1 SART-1 family protein DOT2 [Selaginella moellendorffii]